MKTRSCIKSKTRAMSCNIYDICHTINCKQDSDKFRGQGKIIGKQNKFLSNLELVMLGYVHPCSLQSNGL